MSKPINALFKAAHDMKVRASILRTEAELLERTATETLEAAHAALKAEAEAARVQQTEDPVFMTEDRPRTWRERGLHNVEGYEFYEYVSPARWAGWMPVITYIAVVAPEVIETGGTLAEITIPDGWKMCHACKLEGIKPRKVPAPKVLQDQGIEEVNAYPIRLLDEVMKPRVVG